MRLRCESGVAFTKDDVVVIPALRFPVILTSLPASTTAANVPTPATSKPPASISTPPAVTFNSFLNVDIPDTCNVLASTVAVSTPTLLNP